MPLGSPTIDRSYQRLIVSGVVLRRCELWDEDVEIAFTDRQREPGVYRRVAVSPLVENPLLVWKFEEVHDLRLLSYPFRSCRCPEGTRDWLEVPLESAQVRMYAYVTNAGERREEEGTHQQKHASCRARHHFDSTTHRLEGRGKRLKVDARPNDGSSAARSLDRAL